MSTVENNADSVINSFKNQDFVNVYVYIVIS